MEKREGAYGLLNWWFLQNVDPTEDRTHHMPHILQEPLI